MDSFVNGKKTFVYIGSNADLEHCANGSGGENRDAVEALAPMVFLHGSGGDHSVWAHIADRFRALGHAVYVPDFPAHSNSEGQALSSIEASSDWLASLLDSLKLNKAHLIGHSQGFLTALELAKTQPDRVMSITGVATAASIPVNPELIDLAKTVPLEAAMLMNKWGFYLDEQQPVALAAIEALKAKSVSVMSGNALHADLMCCRNYSAIEAELEQMSVKTHLILARQDKMTPLEAGMRTAQSLSAQVSVIDNAGHMLPYESPENVVKAIHAFLNQINL